MTLRIGSKAPDFVAESTEGLGAPDLAQRRCVYVPDMVAAHVPGLAPEVVCVRVHQWQARADAALPGDRDASFGYEPAPWPGASQVDPTAPKPGTGVGQRPHHPSCL